MPKLMVNMLAGTMFISASKDTSAKLFDIDSLECHKTYSTERPVNSASISPTQDHVSLVNSLESVVLQKKFSPVTFASISRYRSCSAAAKRPWT